jgi:hypothetical protein
MFIVGVLFEAIEIAVNGSWASNTNTVIAAK